jgi:hypothetical protein
MLTSVTCPRRPQAGRGRDDACGGRADGRPALPGEHPGEAPPRSPRTAHLQQPRRTVCGLPALPGCAEGPLWHSTRRAAARRCAPRAPPSCRSSRTRRARGRAQPSASSCGASNAATARRRTRSPPAARAARGSAQGRPQLMGLVSFGLEIGIFCDSLHSVLLLNVILGPEF